MDAERADTRNPTPRPRQRSGPRCPRDGQGEPHLGKVLGVGSVVSVVGGRDERMTRVAELQRGHITRAQLRAVGVTDTTTARLIAQGRLVRVHWGVYVVRPAIAVPLGHETAAPLSCGPNAPLSHGSAAALWKLCEPVDGPVELTVTRRRHRHTPGIVAHRALGLLARDVRVEHGLPVTSPARTLLDRAATLRMKDFERELDEALSVWRIVGRGAARCSDARQRTSRRPLYASGCWSAAPAKPSLNRTRSDSS